MNVEQHPSLETQLYNLAPMSESQLDTLVIDSDACRILIHDLDRDWKADRARAVTSLGLWAG
jgi:hypothetical protein